MGLAYNIDMPKGFQVNNIYRFPKGHIPWSKSQKGIHLSPKSEFKKNDPDISGVNNRNWKGEDASYITKHKWVIRHKGQPSKCEECGKDNLTGHKIHWANISGEYKRDLNDWIRLCAACHFIRDNIYQKMWITRKINNEKRIL